MARARSHRDDSGFTLVEMLMVVTIMGLIAGVLALAVSVFVRNEGSVSGRITETRDLQNLTNYLPVDVASARTITTTPTNPCGSGGTIQLHLEWSEDWDGAVYTNRITYRSFGSPNRLVRFECENSTTARQLTLARAFTSATVTIATDPLDSSKPTGTVYLELNYPDGVRRLSATSRNFLPAGVT